MNWRPSEKEWNKLVERYFKRENRSDMVPPRRMAFEAGADAILKGLKDWEPSVYCDGLHCVEDYITLHGLHKSSEKGWLVFIPDET